MSKYTPILDRTLEEFGNTQKVYKFQNGYGASVVIGSYTYGGRDGKYEIAVLKFDGDNYGLCYDTPITDDVIGHVAPDDIEGILDSIAALATPGAQS